MNQYYNFERAAVSETIVDAFDYNYEMEKVEDAFDGVPPAPQLLSGTLNFSTDTGVASEYQAVLVSIPSGVPYEKGNNVALLVANTAIGPSELQVNDKGFAPVSVSVFGDTVAGDLIAGGIFTFVYDGSKFQTLEMSPRYLQVSIDKAAEAADSAAEAADSAAEAADSAADANDSAILAATFVTPSANSATAAAGSATSAAGSASSATASASAAAGSATAAAGSASTANSRATASASSATSAAGSATSAAGSATSAAGSATSAAGSATAADEAADEAEDRFSDPVFLQMVRELIVDIEYPVGAAETFAANDDPNDVYPWTTWVPMAANRTLRCSQTGSDVGQMIGSDSISLLATHLPAHSHTVNNATSSAYDYASKVTNAPDLGTNTTSSFNYGSITTTAFDYGSITTSSFDHGTKTSDSAGAHTHNFTIYHLNTSDQRVLPGAGGPNVQGSGTFATGSNGAHSHTVAIGSHSHSVPVGSHSHNVAIGSHTHAAIAVGSHSHNVAIGSHTHNATATLSATGSGDSFSVVNSHIKVQAWIRTG